MRWSYDTFSNLLINDGFIISVIKGLWGGEIPVVPALTIKELNRIVNERYETDEMRVVGIILARYDIKEIQEIVDSCYQYWHLNTGKYFDVFWPGYGKYWGPESSTKTIIKAEWNFDNGKGIYFELEDFVEFKNSLKCLEDDYADDLMLLLINYCHGKLNYDDAVKIKLNTNNIESVRSLMEQITILSKSNENIHRLYRRLVMKQVFAKVRSISITEVINIISSIINAVSALIPRE